LSEIGIIFAESITVGKVSSTEERDGGRASAHKTLGDSAGEKAARTERCESRRRRKALCHLEQQLLLLPARRVGPNVRTQQTTLFNRRVSLCSLFKNQRNKNGPARWSR